MQPRSLPTYRYTSTRYYVANSYIGKSVHLLLGQTTYLRNEVAKCKITRFCMVRFTGFACSKVASVAIGISAFDSTRIYHYNREPGHLFSISATSDSTTSMETAPPNMALVCASLLQSSTLKTCYLSRQNIH